ncbi:Uridine kinase [Spraguea lophii 42_110]|uniref:Uridine kinase n=1 Tax=Spraguea lophii (strain 42_110) TaxID=1358809 RepID=S7XIT9_SPRLO|nr:Uridine kinase [Spraguea lophii 42_110]
MTGKIYALIKERFSLSESKKIVIVIHGQSSSGKTTISRTLEKLFNKNDIPNIYIGLDSYYKTFDFSKPVESYDFDNPGAFDFDKIYKTLQAIDNDLDEIPTYSYCYKNKILEGPNYIKNYKPKVVIIEGLYALNLFNKKSFDHENFDPWTTIYPEKLVEKFTYKNFLPLKIRLTLCKNLGRQIRIERDVKERGRTVEFATKQFETQVWPATQRWVNMKEFKEDITIVHGNFNIKMVNALLRGIMDFMRMKSDKNQLDSKYTSLNPLDCSNECRESTESLLLEDN